VSRFVCRGRSAGRTLVLILAFSPFFTPAAPAAVGGLEPAKTYAVIVGVLRWQDPKVPSFSPKNRKDRELYQTLLGRGVPAGNMALLLDEKATLANIHRRLSGTVAKAGPGSTFLFYYAGHGNLGAGGGVSFANYDSAPRRTLQLSGVSALLRKRFKGARVLLMADCCHSGGLAAVARDLAAARIKAASVTSAEASNLSSGNWTFTQAVIDALRGEPLLDANGDGVISLAELDREAADAMKYREAQRSGSSYHGVAPAFSLGPARRKRGAIAGPFRLGEYVQAPDGRKARPGRVVGLENGKYAVEF
jgi:hypothetical protein